MELNHLEIQFLHLHDFKLMISPGELQFYADKLLRYSIAERGTIIDPLSPSVGIYYTASTP
jgi:hypothetical protein